MCRTGCPTKDCPSYAACCKGLQLNDGMSGTVAQKATDSELKMYRQARSEGIQPLGTRMSQVENAMRISDASGVAYKAA